MKHELSRLARLWFPKSRDHAAWLLMEAVGRWWLLLHGWKREYKIYGPERMVIVDFAHPKLNLALEADGDRWHRDVVHEYDRDELLKELGWSVRHYRYAPLKGTPDKVRAEVRWWFWGQRLYHLYYLCTAFMSKKLDR